ncbi:MAG: TerB family tellurite resistance protein, partial [Bacteroidales bacterium]|nr:TerB family tellurite resistance protein [Bacteroidales bacterium]
MDIAITAVLVIIIAYYLFYYSGKKKTHDKGNKAQTKSKNNMKYGKWVGGGLGWAFGGPIGAILGFAFGSMFDGMQTGKYAYEPGTTSRGDFNVSLLILSAAVMKADGRVTKSELEYVKAFLIRQFGPQVGQEQLTALREILKQDFSISDVSRQIGRYMDYSS